MPPNDGFDEEVDLRAADDALVAAELEAAAEAEDAADEDEPEADDSDDEDSERPARGRRRGRRGGRGRRKGGGPLEGTFDHGEEGYGLWLDPAVAGRSRLRRALGGPSPRRRSRSRRTRS